MLDDHFPTKKIPSIDAATASEQLYDVIVVGAGVLGSALSTSLARSGRKVLVIERDLSPPHARIVGELLQPGGCISLDKLGLLDALEGIDAVPCKGYMVIHPTLGSPLIPYPVNTGDKIKNASHKSEWNATDRFQGRSFHHGRFVDSLRQKMVGQHNLDILEATVNDLIECGLSKNKVIGVRCTPKSGSDSEKAQKMEVFAPLTIVADGYASKFRKLVNGSVPPPVTRSYFVGVELEDCKLPQPHHGHVLLPSSAPSNTDGAAIGPILLYGLSPTTTRMLIDVNTSKTPSKSYLLDTVTDRLPESVRPSFREAVADNSAQKVKSMPNSYLPPSKQGQRKAKEGVVLAGDAMNMRHPLTGGGMSVALNDAVLLTELFGGGKDSADPVQTNGNGHANGEANGHANGHTNGHANGYSNGQANGKSVRFEQLDEDSSDDVDEREVCNLEDWFEVQQRLEEWHWRRKGVATCINVLAMALYALFSADDENLDVLRRGCMQYFNLGGECINGPVSLLSALNPSPPVLLYHFFRVAFYAIYLLFTEPRLPAGQTEGKPRPPSILEWPALFIRAIIVFWTACRVILPVLWSEVDF